MIVFRIFSFLGVLLAILFLPFWLVVPIVFAYALVFQGYELLVLSVCIDAQFGDMHNGIWYAYTLLVSLVLVSVVLVKPYLRFYT